jgi:hypothetical protein
MGSVSLVGPDGRVRAETFFGMDAGQSENFEIANDGYLSDLEICDARQRLEDVINGKICGYGGPLGLGGWGGINEVCLQPWNLGGPAREQTPDGYSMKLKLQLVEDYRERVGYIFSATRQTPPKEIEVTARWENGRVKLYQCNPPAYLPPSPPAPTPALLPSLQEAGNSVLSGIGHYMKEVPTYTASLFHGMSSFVDSALAYFKSASPIHENKVAGNP